MTGLICTFNLEEQSNVLIAESIKV